ncbi:MAG: patatin-like phospholipase family protein [Candidatus Methanoperedens sp.]|nr:patatin-like phospholipase family protein [Candidatus Methanoperedens sp.]
MVEDKKIRVAIACQGGGSHTAFTAGALKKILREMDERYEIVGFSGSSGGAICALMAWYSILTKGRDGGREEAIRLLDAFWEDNSASVPLDVLLNYWVVSVSRYQGVIPTPEVSPYFYPPWAQEYLRLLLEKHVDFGRIRQILSSNPASLNLYVGAVEVLSGKFKVFKGTEISADAILASAAVPIFLREIHIGENVYWDGLLSQNPPVRDFVTEHTEAGLKPDEIWIIQINPERRKKEPKSVIEIRDRNNELAGNLSLYQEVSFIEKVNEWVDQGYLPEGEYKHIEMRWIQMSREDLDIASKFDRSYSFVRDMMAHGEKEAGDFLARLP